MRFAADAGGRQASGMKRVEHLRLRHVAHWLDAIETGGFHGFEFIENAAAFHLDGGVHDAFAKLTARVVGEKICRGGESAESCACFDEGASVHEVSGRTRQIV